MKLSAAQISQYQREGYICPVPEAMRDVLYAGAEKNPQRL